MKILLVLLALTMVCMAFELPKRQEKDTVQVSRDRSHGPMITPETTMTSLREDLWFLVNENKV